MGGFTVNGCSTGDSFYPKLILGNQFCKDCGAKQKECMLFCTACGIKIKYKKGVERKWCV